MFASSSVCMCVSNNSDLAGKVRELVLCDGSALSVIKKARDYVHVGWRIAANPLYGNFKPNQQPYRTILLYRQDGDGTADIESLTLIENALRVFEDAQIVRVPGEYPAATEKDFRYLDFVLMEETLKTFGVLSGSLSRVTGRDSA